MKKSVDLLNSNILAALTKLSIPIVLSSFIQMAYNMTDMIWLGRLGSEAVTASGTAGMYLWFSNGVALLAKIGAQAKTGYSIGAGHTEDAAEYAAASLKLTTFLGLIFGAVCLLFTDGLIDFFNLSNPEIISEAKVYLRITGGLVCFSFLNQVFSGLFTAMGSSLMLLVATSVGLITNIILDPFLIFGYGFFPRLGVMGAAIATVFAQFIVFFIFVILAARHKNVFRLRKLLSRLPGERYGEIVRIGFPLAVQNIAFTSISMVIARLIAGFGDAAVAVQKVGSQIESVSWTISDGFSASINAFLAQNYGAGKKNRIAKGYHNALFLASGWGLLCSILLYFFAGPLFRFFLPDQALLSYGIDYLQILAVSQVFMCVEIMTAGAFSGLENTLPPAVSGIVLTGARIPLAMLLSATALGLTGIWWSISVTTVAKGVVLVVWFFIFLRRKGYKSR